MNLEESVKEMQKDVRYLKLKAFQPEKVHAKVFLEYLSWEDDNPKKNFELLYATEIKIFNDWLKVYCEEYSCTQVVHKKKLY